MEINAFDLNESTEDKFVSQCPELMKFSGRLDVEGESRYTINIHYGIDVEDVTFDRLIISLPRTTYVFVALGEDEKNIAAAVKLRRLFERMNCNPQIQASVLRNRHCLFLFYPQYQARSRNKLTVYRAECKA